ncbi:MAG: leucine-rich repeat domain-containing protein, partial [Acutalibacteraceae bacterium]
MKNSKHTLTRVLACIMVVLMTVAAVPFNGFSASAAGTVVKSGNCGKNGSNVSFTLYSNGTLEISGSGEMEDYKFYKYPPYSNFIVDEENNDEWYGNNEDYEDLTEGYRGYDETVKKVVVKSGITAIGNFAFASFKNLVSVSIPDTVTSIGRCAFYLCYRLKSITIPSSVTTIKDAAFMYSGLTAITLPDGIKEIESFTFFGADITAISIPNGVTSIGYSAFSECFDLEKLSVPDSVTTIEDDAFYFCEKLSDIKISKNLTRLGSYAFDFTGYYDNDKNWSDGVLYLGNALIAIDREAHSGKWSYEIKSGTKCIVASAFNGSDLTSIVIPGSVKEIPEYAFAYCEKLTSVKLSSGLQTIQQKAFMGCTKLSSISLPTSLKAIGKLAFSDTALNSVVLAANITNIKTKAFGYQLKDAADEFNPEYIKVSGFTVKGYNNTAAQKYAKDNGFKF